MRHGLSTAEAALGRVGRAGVGEHDDGVADRQVSPIARYREKDSNLPLRKAEEPSPSSSGNFVHVFIVVYYRLVLLLPAACCRSSTFVCTGQRLVCARVVLWCTSGLAPMKHFATVPSDMVVAYFFIYLCSVFLRQVFLEPEPTPAGFA